MKGEKTMSEAREIYCVKCGCVESAEEMVYVASEDAFYCESCASDEGFVKCAECGSWHHIDDTAVVVVSRGEEQVWCDDCISRFGVTCDHCGRIYDSRWDSMSSVYEDGCTEDWCDDCVADYAVECHDCGEWVSRDSATYTSYGYYVCDSCKDNDYTWCDDCDELYRNDDIYESDGHCICTNCAPYNDYWFWCEECGNYVYETVWNYGAECCDACVGVNRRSNNARVRSYHGDEPPMRYFGKKGSVFKGLGIELEIDREYSDPSKQQLCLNALDELFDDRAYFKHDGSLNHGIEIVTLPHSIEEFYKLPWREILGACISYGYSSHEIGTCGLHVHISRTMFGDDEDTQADNIAKLMQFYNLYWDDIVRVSRRTKSQVEQWANKYNVVRRDTLKKWAGKKEWYRNRYMAVNITNDKTVEIRINRGTLKYETFLATIDFVMTTAINSKNIDWVDVSDDFLWLKGLKRETLNYLSSRYAFSDPVNYYTVKFHEEDVKRIQEESERLRAELGDTTRYATSSFTTSTSSFTTATFTTPHVEVVRATSGDEFEQLFDSFSI